MNAKPFFVATIILIIGMVGCVAYISYEDDKGPVDDYDFQLIRTDGLSTEFYLIFNADEPGTVSANLDGVGILINGQGSIPYDAGHNSIQCEIRNVGLSGVTLLNALDLRFT